MECINRKETRERAKRIPGKGITGGGVLVCPRLLPAGRADMIRGDLPRRTSFASNSMEAWIHRTDQDVPNSEIGFQNEILLAKFLNSWYSKWLAGIADGHVCDWLTKP